MENLWESENNRIGFFPMFDISQEKGTTHRQNISNFSKASVLEEEYIPLVHIANDLDFDRWDMHLLMTTLSWECDPKFRWALKAALEQEKPAPLTLANLVYLYRTYSDLLVDADFFARLNRWNMLFFGGNTPITWRSNLQLNPTALSILVGQTPKLPYYAHIKEEMPLLYLPFANFHFDNLLQLAKEKVIVFIGGDGCGKKSSAHFLSRLLEKDTLFVNGDLFCSLSKVQIQQDGLTLLRLAKLQDKSLCFYDLPEKNENNQEQVEEFLHLLDIYKQQELLCFMTTADGTASTIWKHIPHLQIPVSMPNTEQQKALWKFYGKDLTDDQINTMVNVFDISPQQICATLQDASHKSKDLETLISCCYNQSTKNLGENAQKIEPAFSWDDIILDSNLKAELQQSCNHIKFKKQVYTDWGFGKRFSYGTGTNILFTGPPGTGKTMLAQVIANDLHMELYRIDLSAVISKYIGETEKNLEKIFDDAKNSGVILFFDEMDSLFGKRSENQDSHDKYANMETAYLLQKIEQYDGLVLMATNYLSNIDEAFFRRIHFVFQIPLPACEERLLLWKKAIPDAVPTDFIDFDFLAETFVFSGATIKNIGLSAGFLAANEDKNLNMHHILKAMSFDLMKQNKLLLPKDLGKYSYIWEALDAL